MSHGYKTKISRIDGLLFSSNYGAPLTDRSSAKTVFNAMLQIVHYFEDIYGTISSFVR